MPKSSRSPCYSIWRRYFLLLTVVTLAGCQEDISAPVTTPTEAGLAAAASAALSFNQISAGHLHTCGVSMDGQAYCWGDNSTGQLGDGTTERRAAPTPVAGGLR